MCQMRSLNSAGAYSSIPVGCSRMCPSESMYRSPLSVAVTLFPSVPSWCARPSLPPGSGAGAVDLQLDDLVLRLAEVTEDVVGVLRELGRPRQHRRRLVELHGARDQPAVVPFHVLEREDV